MYTQLSYHVFIFESRFSLSDQIGYEAEMCQRHEFYFPRNHHLLHPPSALGFLCRQAVVVTPVVLSLTVLHARPAQHGSARANEHLAVQLLELIEIRISSELILRSLEVRHCCIIPPLTT